MSDALVPRCSLARGAVAGAVLATLCIEPARASAEDSVEPVRLDFHAGPSCPDGAAFLGAVQARTPRVRSAVEGESARILHVTISAAEGSQVTGDFSVTTPHDPKHESRKRTITGESCAEVCDALALFAAISLDPKAIVGELPADHAASAAATKPTPTGGAPLRLAPRRPEAQFLGQRREKRSRVARVTGIVGAHLGGMSAGTPSPLLLLEPFVEIGLHPVEARGVFVAPTLRLGFSTTGANTARAADGFAHIHWTTLRLDVCPLELRLGRAFSAQPCLAASGGSLSATGEDITHPNSQRLPWSSIGGLIRAQWNFARPFVLEVDGGLDVPLRRDRLYFEPSTTVYRAPAAMPRVSIGVGWHFL